MKLVSKSLIDSDDVMEIDLSNCHLLNEKSLIALIKCLREKSNSVKILRLDENEFSSSVLAQLSAMLLENHSLMRLVHVYPDSKYLDKDESFED